MSKLPRKLAPKTPRPSAPLDIVEAAEFLCFRLEKGDTSRFGPWITSIEEDRSLPGHWTYTVRSCCKRIRVSRHKMHGGKNEGMYSAGVSDLNGHGAPHSSWSSESADPVEAVNNAVRQAKAWVTHYVKAIDGL